MSGSTKAFDDLSEEQTGHAGDVKQIQTQFATRAFFLLAVDIARCCEPFVTMVRINVKTLDRRKFELDLNDNMSVLDLKSTVAAKVEIAVDEIKLVLNGKVVTAMLHASSC